MRFGILGPFEVIDDAGRPVEVGGGRLRALLAMLLLDVGHPVGVDRLTDGLWGDCPPADAANALQSLVSRLRSALEPARPAGSPGRLVESGPGGYRLAVPPDTVDAHRFTALAAAGHRELVAGHAATATATLAGALAQWRGEALAGVTDAPFAPAAVARLAEARLAAAEDHAEAALTAGRHAEIVGDVETLADANPLRERLRGLAVRTLYACGRQADALAAYQRTQRALAEELGVDPSPELRAVHLAVLRHDPALAPVTRPSTPSLSHRPRSVAHGVNGADQPDQPDRPDQQAGRPATNLRAQLTSFVGRDEEVRRVGKLLAETRLVTLVGPGGAGKTRLATESAGRLGTPPPDGVWLVELAPVSDPADLPQAVADALGVRETALLARPGEPTRVQTADPTDVLVRALAGRRLLIVLDNCEHLVDAAARLVDRVLADCPQVRVLATSREPLGITGETLCPVPPLPAPPDNIGADDALSYPAVRLFADRGVAVRPDFTVHEGNVAAVAGVCRRLDGMPLAIELAAARLRALSVEQIAARLDNRFRLLTAGSRTALPRHQTLRAVVEWSWDLLGERERTLARRLSVFPAGATVQAAEQVCAGAGLAAEDVLDTLTALVDKSLVEIGDDVLSEPVDASGPAPDSAVRYRMLETVRAYAAERLAAAGEEATLRRAHAHYFLDLVETADPQLRGHGQLGWMHRLAAEQENAHAALRWAVDTPDPVVALRMTAGLSWYWVLRGQHTEAMSWARQVAAAVGERPPAGHIAQYLICQIGASMEYLDVARLGPAIEDGLRRLAEAGEPEPRTPMFMMLRMIAGMVSGETDTVDALFESWMDDPDPWVRAFGRSARGGIRINQGRLEGAAHDLEIGLAECRAVGDRWAWCQCLTAMSELAGYSGDNARVVALLDEAGRLAGELGATAEVPEMMIRRAVARARADDLPGAEADLAEAGRWIQHETHANVRAFLLSIEAEFARRRGDLAGAERRCAQALATVEAAGVGAAPQTRAAARCVQAMLAVSRGDLGSARNLVADALADPLLLIDRPVVAGALETLGTVEMAGADAERAALLLGAAATMRGADDLGNPVVAALADEARRALGGPAYTVCYQRGAALDPPDLFDLIGVTNPAVPPGPGSQVFSRKPGV